MRVVKMGHTQQVKGLYRVRIVVPPGLRPFLPPPHTGKANLVKALRTGNEREANRLAVPIIADFLGMIEEAKRQAAPTEWRHFYLPPQPWQPFSARIVRRLVPVGSETIETHPVVESAPVTVTGGPVSFDSMVEQWARERNIPDRGKRLMQSKANRFAEFLTSVALLDNEVVAR
jgi:hypothetical protein